MNKRTIKYLVILPTLLWLPLIASAAGIQVSPAKLDFIVSDDKSSSQSVTIVNPTADVQVFEVYADDFMDIIKSNPQSFTLESGARKVVEIKVSSPKDSGQLATNLSVVGKPLADNKFSVGTGVKIPLTISMATAAPKNNQQTVFWVLGIVVLLAAITTVNKYKTTKKPSA